MTIDMSTQTGRSRTATTVVALVGATFLWSTNYLLALGLQDVLSPVHLTFLRWGLATPFLIVAAWLMERTPWRTVMKDLPRHVLMAVSGLLLYNLLNYQALHFTGPTNAAVVNAMNPILIALLAWVVLRIGLSRMGVVGLAVSFIGVLVVLGRGSLATFADMELNVGELLVLLAGVCWAMYAVTAGGLRSGPITAVAVQAAIAAIVLSPWMVIAPPERALSGEQVVFLVLLVAFPTAIAFVLWNVAVSRVGPAPAGIAINLMPFFTAVLATTIGVQQLHPSLIVGGMLIVGGVLLSTVRVGVLRRAATTAAKG